MRVRTSSSNEQLPESLFPGAAVQATPTNEKNRTSMNQGDKPKRMSKFKATESVETVVPGTKVGVESVIVSAPG